MEFKSIKYFKAVFIPVVIFFSTNSLDARIRVPEHVRINDVTEFSSSLLPIIIIDTQGQRIPASSRITADMGVIYNDKGKRNHLTDAFNNYDGKIAIETRGSATAGYPKAPYRLETQDDLGQNRNIDLLGMPKENDWILYAPYDDQSLIRNNLAFNLSNGMGRYAVRTQFCELLLNGDYRGLYVLMEKIKQDKNRVDIADMDTDDIAGDSLTGGYIIKIDKWAGENVGGWDSQHGTTYQYHDPQPDVITAEQKNYIQTFMDDFENAMNSEDIANPENGYPRFIDVDSFVDHFILCETAKNVDSYRISAFMSKDRDSKGGKLVMGPIWDFNLSFGKAWFSEDLFVTEGWQVDYNLLRPWDMRVPFWWEKLSRNKAFVNRLSQRYFSLRQGLLSETELYKSIDQLIEETAEARERNFARWPETASSHTYEEEIQQMKEWISARLQWIDENIDDLANVNGDDGSGIVPDQFVLQQNYPNPFNIGTHIRFGLPEPALVSVDIYNIRGEKQTNLYNGIMTAGYHVLPFQAGDLPSGIYIYRLYAGPYTLVKSMVFIK
jgi:hypothetical protein